GEAAEGPTGAPSEAGGGGWGAYRLRKRPDGACGFLSPAGLCRIHEELGADKKPLACRLFPFRFHPAEGAPLVTASFSCPTVVANTGALLGEQQKELAGLRRDWQGETPEPAPELRFVDGQPVAGRAARAPPPPPRPRPPP